ncbi:unnamed protein product, partial [Cuscuta epithymum]
MVPLGSDYKSYEEVHQGFVSGFDISWDTSRYSGAPPSVYMCELHGWFALGDDDDSCRKVDHRNVGGIIIEIWKTLKGSYLDIIYMIGLLLATKAAIGAPFMIALLIY